MPSDTTVKLGLRSANTGSFDIFAHKKKYREKKSELMAKAGHAVGFKTAAQLQRTQLPVPWLALQYVMGRPGIPMNTLNEFLGQECTAKSSLMMALAGHWVKNNIPVYYINTEPKALESEWISRLVSRDPDMGLAIADAIDVSEQTFTLDDMDSKLRSWVDLQRNKTGIPISVPLVVIVDTITNLMNPDEAAVSVTEKSKQKTLDHGVADIGAKPGVTAKWQQAWVRQMTQLCSDYNVTIICVSGTNQDMNAGPYSSAARNKTKTGGCALNKETGLQISVIYKGQLKASNKTIGKTIQLTNLKNSFGSDARLTTYNLITENLVTTDTYQQFPLDFDTAGANLLCAHKLFGLSVNSGLYTSEELQIYQGTAETVMQRIDSDDSLKLRAWTGLGLCGFDRKFVKVKPKPEDEGETEKSDPS